MIFLLPFNQRNFMFEISLCCFLKRLLMLKTVKSKIVFLSVFVLVFLCGVVSFFSYLNYKNAKKLTITASDFEISTFAREIEKQILVMENKAIDLALIGELYYKTDRSATVTNSVIQEFFEKSPELLGGGIWFKGYMLGQDQKRHCFYAYHDDQGKVLLDEQFASEEYDYLNQKWYLEVMSSLSQKNKIEWSSPYFENQGSETMMTTVGAGIYYKGELIGLSTIDWKIGDVVTTLMHMKPTPHSFSLVADKDNDFVIGSTDPCLSQDKLFGTPLHQVSWYHEGLSGVSFLEYDGKKFLCNVKELGNGLIFIMNIPEEELFQSIKKIRLWMFLFLFSAICLTVLAIYLILERNINRPIKSLTHTAELLGQGNMDAKNYLKKPEEFAHLAQAFNQMGQNLKEYIEHVNTFTKEKEHIATELDVAGKIQSSYLPSFFYPEVKEFNIFAMMDPAREIGGDFYDFFFISLKQFVFLIADVSGKGVPAALFMMTVKTTIKNMFNDKEAHGRLISKINNKIQENNQYGFFVTAFIGIVDLETGKIAFINCGHNPPLICRTNGKFEYLKTDTNMALGALDDFEYHVTETILHKGDVLFLYTDGLTEALNGKREFYGEERLENCLNNIKTNDPRRILEGMKKNVEDFVQGTSQSDDLTMLAFKYNGIQEKPDERHVTLLATTENYDIFSKWLNDGATAFGLPMKTVQRLNLVAEESFTNVAGYAYINKSGYVDVSLVKKENKVILKLTDSGFKFNPLLRQDPDVSVGLEERTTGGLGIFLVKQMSDKVTYRYIKGKNILTITLKIDE